MDMKNLWEKVVDFHGHECPGLAIGFKAAIGAMDLLETGFSEDEELVCITENDACGVDAIQVLLGCSVGKGNLIMKIRGKSAYSFYSRKSGKAVRLVFKGLIKDMDMDRQLKQDFILKADYKELFEVKEVKEPLVEKARIFDSIVCENCREITAEPFIRLEAGKKVCIDCYNPYSRSL